MVHQAVTLDARSRVDTILPALESLSDDAYVVVRRREGLQVYWYTFTVLKVKGLLGSAPPDATLKLALDLHESSSTQAVQFADQKPASSGVLLDGDVVLGVLEADPAPVSPTRGMDGPPSPEPTFEWESAGPIIPPPPEWESAGPIISLPPEILPPPSPGTRGLDPSPTASASFEAYPALSAPSQVAPGVAFTLGVGLRREALPGVRTEVMRLKDAPETFTVSVQMIAPGFAFVDGYQREMIVQHDRLDSASVSFSLVALELDANEDAVAREITVQFSYQGQPVARAWHDLHVARVGAVVSPVVLRGAVATPLTDLIGPPIDLIAYIEEGEGPGELVWRLDSPHAFPKPLAADLESRIGSDNGVLFASEQVRNLTAQEGTALLASAINGVAREVARVVPAGFFAVLEYVWLLLREHNAGAIPSVLLVGQDAFVPWELASLEDQVHATLLDASRPLTLGGQCRVGRWLPPKRTSRLADLAPALPPSATRKVSAAAILVGNYAPAAGLPALVNALDEGRQLAQLFSPNTVSLSASADDVSRLLQGTLLKDHSPIQVQLVHFACHGSFDPGHIARNGLILEDGRTRLDPNNVRGSQVGKTAPFVFLNACQTALAQPNLSDSGGFAQAFLQAGCQGFIAPLWNVNDALAKDIALNFYRQALDSNITVGELMRGLRQDFVGPPIPSSTPMAYVYFGHPDLQLTRA